MSALRFVAWGLVDSKTPGILDAVKRELWEEHGISLVARPGGFDWYFDDEVGGRRYAAGTIQGICRLAIEVIEQDALLAEVTP